LGLCLATLEHVFVKGTHLLLWDSTYIESVLTGFPSKR